MRRFLTRTTPLLLAGVILLQGLFPLTTTAQQPASNQHLLEAGFITKFPLFVTWPDEPWREKGGVFIVGAMGETAVLPHLQQLARLTTVYGNPISIRNVRTIDDMAGCQIVFIADTEVDRLDAILARARAHNILVVSDTDGFAQQGVHINFFRVGDHVRFEINETACDRAELRLSFRLKNVARLIDGGDGDD